MKIRAIFFWLILVVFIGMAILWMFYFPYSRVRLYRAIPSNAIFISEHTKLGERWKSIACNPFTLCLLASAGIKQEGLKDAVLDPAVVTIIKRFAPVNTVIAYVPSLNGTGESAWVLSSWVGGSGQLFRWSTRGMLAGANLKKVRLEGGRQIWQIAKKQNLSDPDLSFAIVEGVLLGCLSRDPLGVRHLINRIEYSAPVQPDLSDQLNIAASLMERDRILDHGYIRWQQADGEEFKVRKFRYALNVCDESSLAGWIKGDIDLLIPVVNGATNILHRNTNFSLGDSPGLSDLSSVIGRNPDMIAVLPYSLIEPLLSGRYVSRGVRIISKVVSSQIATNSAMFISMFSADLSGRILGLKVPSIITGVTVMNESSSIARVSETVDILNALYKLAMIPRREEISGKEVVVFDSTRQQGIYDSIAPTDKPAITTKERWLTISSSVGTLTNVVFTPIGQNAGRISHQWIKGIRDIKDCVGYFWVDIKSASEAIKNIIAVYSLMLIAQNADGATAIRNQLEMLQTWIKILQPIKTAEFRLRFSKPDFELQFLIGPTGN